MNEHVGFNPRSQLNSDALSQFIVDDLCQASDLIASAVNSDKLEVKLNADVHTKVAVRNVDAVLRVKAMGNRGAVRVAIENKTIMTAHGKARKNRYGDIIAYSGHVHNHSRDTVAGATIIINCCNDYANPDGFAKGLVRPRFNMAHVVATTLKIFENIPLRNNSGEPNDQPEALAVIVVNYDGKSDAKLVTDGLAPKENSVNHYDSFVQKIAETYSSRFASLGYDDEVLMTKESGNTLF